MRAPTVTLLVKLRKMGARDRLGNKTVSYAEPVPVPGCLFAPATTADLAVERPEGTKVTATAHFPKGYKEDLAHAKVSLDGEKWFDVVGEPVPFPDPAVRGRWGMQVTLGRVNG